MSIIELFILSVGLAMDAFAVSICASLVLAPEQRMKGAMKFGGWFGLFQFLMPVIGYFAATLFAEHIMNYDHWIAFTLLLYLGSSMIKEANEECEVQKSYTIKEMVVFAIATSIDALAVGISFAFLNVNIWTSSIMIGVITFIISAIGCLMGFKLGAAFGSKANIFGGLVLIGIGVKILLEHTIFA
ncbi:MAG: manganese efflux pump MntP family protein [Phascolarctobacterium sp.]|nr:manganese efflux pump MntP family protein [Phascolarctobacterium sp.]